MKKLKLIRIAYLPDRTFGVLLDEGIPFALTLELPWKNNEQNISCIPEGIYLCKPFSSEKHPHAWQVMDVPDRTAILFHTANIVKDIEGCIGIGEQFEYIFGEPGIAQSKDGFEEFSKRVEFEKEFEIQITYVQDSYQYVKVPYDWKIK